MSATYSPEDNKLRLYPSTRLDAETYARVRAAGFIWAPKQDLFVAPMWTPEREDLLVELAGDIDDEDTSLVERAEQRADRFEDYRDHRARDAESARKAVAAIADHIPLGQPILVGHHSERHARRDAERIENGMRRAVKMWRTSQYWSDRAAGALRHAKYKELPTVRARRIKKLESELRGSQRSREKSLQAIQAWAKLNAPGNDGRPCDDELRQKRALFCANHFGCHFGSGDTRGWCLWSAVEDGKVIPREAQLIALKHYARSFERSLRWIAHYENRLTYERAMLEEQGATDLLKPKPKSAAAQLPLCNYRAPQGLDIENKWNRGEIIHYPQVEMASADWARINADYKGTRVVGNSHRVRTTMQRHALVSVFLTDSKVHQPPAPQPKPERTMPALATPRALVSDRTERADDGAVYRAMADTIRAGVQVVSAPQLFPTPPDLALRVVTVADIRPEHRVLEPSAGTGALLDAIGDKAGPVTQAVEINTTLAGQLRARFPLVTVLCADFLDCNGDLGTFDRIVMNPPFVNGADIQHIQHARQLLNPGGKLVAICANGPRQREHLMPIAEAWIDLPAGTFSEQGTNVNTAIVVLGRTD